MHVFAFLRCAILTSLVGLFSSSALAQTPALSAAQQREILQTLAEQVAEVYVFPDSVAQVQTFLREREASGAYADVTAPEAFGRHVTEDLRAFTRDNHFAVQYNPAQYQQMETMFSAMEEGDRAGLPRAFQIDPASPMAQQFRSANYFFRVAEVLEGNVGYLKIDQMPPLDLAQPTVDAAMAFLANTEAMILDLRGTPGGIGGFIPYLMSYFFPSEPMLLYTRDFGAADSMASFYTHDTIGGPRRPEVPLFVLADRFTGSAAENLAYTVQQHGRATIVGGVTAGAAHSARRGLLAHGFVANIPMARVVHPVSQTNWERVGVQPDVAVDPTDALTMAHRLALDALVAEAHDPQQRHRLERVRAQIEEADGPAPDAEAVVALEAYVGNYGIRRVFIEGGVLMLQREGGLPLPLRRTEGERFQISLPPGMRAANSLPDVLFRRDAGGAVTGFAFVRADGSIEEEIARDR